MCNAAEIFLLRILFLLLSFRYSVDTKSLALGVINKVFLSADVEENVNDPLEIDTYNLLQNDSVCSGGNISYIRCGFRLIYLHHIFD